MPDNQLLHITCHLRWNDIANSRKLNLRKPKQRENKGSGIGPKCRKQKVDFSDE